MKPVYLFLSIFIVLFSCKKESTKPEVKEELIMYEASEMTVLMRDIYEFNKALKVRIEEKKELLEYPNEFFKINTAKLTNPDYRNAEFDSLATIFLENQRASFSPNTDSLVINYNKSIKACIECHKTRCTGPLPKIKKLMIH
ncbi:MAG: hypothetical protein L3J34_04715 [Flavobacteriaceae bacterium]|nr:hypothetical protein [Flavobacteriaceae bacterium]